MDLKQSHPAWKIFMNYFFNKFENIHDFFRDIKNRLEIQKNIIENNKTKEEKPLAE